MSEMTPINDSIFSSSVPGKLQFIDTKTPRETEPYLPTTRSRPTSGS